MDTTTTTHEGNGQDVKQIQPTNRITSSDPFDLDRLRLNQDFTKAAGVRKVLTVIPCRKPNRHEFVRVREGDDWVLETAILEDKITREDYLVSPDVYSEVMEECFNACLLTAITRQGDLFLWRVRLPGADGRTNDWNESMMQAAQLGRQQWVRVSANMNVGLYDVHVASSQLAEPDWPDYTLKQLLELCF
ncbi:MAG: hypothetical protein IID37_04665, partial [Planctomycetes bacterium]|nr:hypothetical protein [Planctomycetota bacterium]